jgi:hypothetical protein
MGKYMSQPTGGSYVNICSFGVESINYEPQIIFSIPFKSLYMAMKLFYWHSKYNLKSS